MENEGRTEGSFMNGGSAVRVLVVEDDRNILLLICHTLRREGWIVSGVGSARDGLRLLREEKYDVVLSDVQMTEMDGYKFLDCVRGMPESADIPFIFITARAQANDQIRGTRSGADDYITKPFDPVGLPARVSAVISRRRGGGTAKSGG